MTSSGGVAAPFSLGPHGSKQSGAAAAGRPCDTGNETDSMIAQCEIQRNTVLFLPKPVRQCGRSLCEWMFRLLLGRRYGSGSRSKDWVALDVHAMLVYSSSFFISSLVTQESMDGVRKARTTEKMRSATSSWAAPESQACFSGSDTSALQAG